jgi:hypothetical protein
MFCVSLSFSFLVFVATCFKAADAGDGDRQRVVASIPLRLPNQMRFAWV